MRSGRAPAAIVAEARQQLQRYDTVAWKEGTADGARIAPDGRFEFGVAAAFTAERIELANSGALGKVVLASAALENPEFPAAKVRTPVLLACDAARSIRPAPA